MVEPVDVRGLPARAAVLREKMLLEFHPVGVEVVALQRAGIAEARIATLYPFELAEAEVELLRFLRRWPRQQLLEIATDFFEASGKFFLLLGEEESELEETWSVDFEAFWRSETGRNLHARMQTAKRGDSDRLVFDPSECKRCIEFAFDCWWLLTNWTHICQPPATRFANTHHARLNMLLGKLEAIFLARGADLR